MNFNFLPLWYKLLAMYLLLLVPLSYWFLERKTYSQVREMNKTRKEDDKLSLDFVSLYVTSLFYPLVILLKYSINFISILINIVTGIVEFIILVFNFLLDLIKLPIVWIISLFSKKENDKKWHRK